MWTWCNCFFCLFFIISKYSLLHLSSILPASSHIHYPLFPTFIIILFFSPSSWPFLPYASSFHSLVLMFIAFTSHVSPITSSSFLSLSSHAPFFFYLFCYRRRVHPPHFHLSLRLLFLPTFSSCNSCCIFICILFNNAVSEN